MGAIVSHRKDPQRSRVEHKTSAVNAFSAKPQQTQINHLQGSFPEVASTVHHSKSGRSNTNLAVSSWGEGVVGTSTHSLHNTGVVTSRGVEQDVTTSKDLYPGLTTKIDQNKNTPKKSKKVNGQMYTDFATVTPLKPQEAAIVIQSSYRGYKTRKDIDKQREATLEIQRHVRGYQARRELKTQQVAAMLIQKKYRNHLDNKDVKDRVKGFVNADQSDDDDDGSDEWEGEKIARYRKPWKESTPSAPVLDNNIEIGEKTKESFKMYQEDITDLKWKTEQQLEMTTMGDSYIPPRLLLIASNIPRADVLQTIVRNDAIRICYDFTTTTFETLLGELGLDYKSITMFLQRPLFTSCFLKLLHVQLSEEVSEQLEKYKKNSKAQSIGLVCSGGPGFINPIKGKMVTKAKLKQAVEMSSFWRSLGTKMSKLDPKETVIHIIGNNVAGNTQGVKLLKCLSKLMRPSKVKVQSPLEISAAGKQMLESYFNFLKYRTWRSRMYSKVAFTL